MTAPTITAAWLERQGACPEQVAVFRATFGESAIVTPETLAQAVTADLNLGWLTLRALTAQAWAEFLRRTAREWAEYMQAPRLASVAAKYHCVRDAALVALLANPANWREKWDAAHWGEGWDA